MASEKIYKVFVSSTYEDLREERAAVEKGLLQIDCWPVGMELFPAADQETWDFIKSQIDDSDYYVVVIAVGTVAKGLTELVLRKWSTIMQSSSKSRLSGSYTLIPARLLRAKRRLPKKPG